MQQDTTQTQIVSRLAKLRPDSVPPKVEVPKTPAVPETDQPVQSAKINGKNGDKAKSMFVATSDPRAFLKQLIKYAFEKEASDIHLRVNAKPTVRVRGVLVPVEHQHPLSSSFMDALVNSVLNDKHREILESRFQIDLSIDAGSLGRLRVNVFRQRGTNAMAMRLVSSKIPTIEDLKMPPMVSKFSKYERGMVILTGATGSGKSTTIAALLNQVNKARPCHIITIEDPVEYLFTDETAIISQRELDIDAYSFPEAMRAALREDPDVMLVGEMRDPETIEFAMTAAETGHLVFTTLHAPTASDTVTRIISAFSPEAQPTIRAKLAQNLRAVIAQRLLPSADGTDRVPACEVMTVSARVRELILDPLRIKEIADLIKQDSIAEGMLSFDKHLYQLAKDGLITEEIALQHATSSTDLKLMLDGFVTS